MIWSMSRSKNWFMALAPAAASDPPNSVDSTSHTLGNRPAARTMVGTVVIRSRTTILGLVSWKYAAVRWRTAPAPDGLAALASASAPGTMLPLADR